MVVDDDSEVAYYLELLLGSDYQVVCRFNAESALEAITESVPDLILSDVVMPGKDGYWLCRGDKGEFTALSYSGHSGYGKDNHRKSGGRVECRS